MKKLGGLWNKTSKTTNKKYLSGTLEFIPGLKTNIMIMKNDKKELGSKQPDFLILLQEERKNPTGLPVVKVSEEDLY